MFFLHNIEPRRIQVRIKCIVFDAKNFERVIATVAEIFYWRQPNLIRHRAVLE
jgi:hypothetical protein